MIIDNDVVYKRINNKTLIRKDVLNIAIESIKLLQDYERIRSIRREKYQLLLYAREKISELNRHVEELRDKIPKAKIEKEKPLKFDIKDKELVEQEHRFKIERPKTFSLDSELELIKSKLESLNIS